MLELFMHLVCQILRLPGDTEVMGFLGDTKTDQGWVEHGSQCKVCPNDPQRDYEAVRNKDGVFMCNVDSGGECL